MQSRKCLAFRLGIAILTLSISAQLQAQQAQPAPDRTPEPADASPEPTNPATAGKKAVRDVGQDPQDGALGQIVVYSTRSSRQEQTVTAAALALLPPGSSPLKAIARLPGVALQSADPFGTYELGTRLAVRGFNQSQMGYTLDGVPLGDMFYNTWNGLHISRAIATENIARTEFAQGAGRLGIASTSNLGGSLEFFSRAPADAMGGEVAATVGSNAARHLYGRFESGRLKTGTRISLSGVYHDADKWKGEGGQSDRKFNGKVTQEVGEGTLSAWVNYSMHRERNYADLSPATLARIGYDLDFLAPDYATAIRLAQVSANQTAAKAGRPLPYPAAGTLFPAPFTNVNDTYYDSGGVRRDWIGALTLDLPVNERVNLKATYYAHTDKGSGGIYTPAVASPGGFALSVRTTEYGVKRNGGMVDATFLLGAHTLSAGYWYEDNRGTTDRNYYAAGEDLRPDVVKFLSGAFRSDFQTDLRTITNQFYVADRWQLSPAVVIDAGFKGSDIRNSIVTTWGTPFINGSIRARDWFQPQVGVRWQLGGAGEVFANYAENMRAFQSSFRGPFGTTQAGFEAIRHTLKPETSRTIEGGWRFRASALQGSLTLYDVKFRNRLLAAFSSANILGNPSILQNVGSVSSQGVEVGATWRLRPAFALIGSYSYNRSRYDGDTVNGTGVVQTRGVRPVDTPAHLAKLELDYDDSRFFANLSGMYTSERNVTYSGDVTTPGYAVFDAVAGWHFGGADTRKRFDLQLNVTNLANRRYIAALGSGQFFNDRTALNNTLQAGAPRQWFVSVRKQF